MNSAFPEALSLKYAITPFLKKKEIIACIKEQAKYNSDCSELHEKINSLNSTLYDCSKGALHVDENTCELECSKCYFGCSRLSCLALSAFCTFF